MGPTPVMRALLAKLDDPRVSHLGKHAAQTQLDNEVGRQLSADVKSWIAAGRPEGPTPSTGGAGRGDARRLRAERPLEKVLAAEEERERQQSKGTEAPEVDVEKAIKLAYEILSDPNASPEMREEIRAILVALGEDPDAIGDGAKAIAHMGGFSGAARRTSAL